MVREIASSAGGKASVLLSKELDTEEGISDKMHPSTIMLVNNTLEENLTQTSQTIAAPKNSNDGNCC